MAADTRFSGILGIRWQKRRFYLFISDVRPCQIQWQHCQQCPTSAENRKSNGGRQTRNIYSVSRDWNEISKKCQRLPQHFRSCWFMVILPTVNEVSRQLKIKMAAFKPEVRCISRLERNIREIPTATLTLFYHTRFNCNTAHIVIVHRVHSGNFHLPYFTWNTRVLVLFSFHKSQFGLVRRCGIVGSTLAFGSIGHGFESEHRLFSHHSALAFSKLRSFDDSVRCLV